jgi:hypothetical protein
MEFFIVFGIVAVPLFLLGLFAVYKGRKMEAGKKGGQTPQGLQV